ncbi:MAG: DUF262 domain-containing protein [Candidatus Poribacteria bacterium]|nr:DUF262 domain-containing protein [Candidatus Poribacteria bacterium]
MQTTATNKKIRTLLADIRNEILIPRPEFQRRLVWSNKHKSAFIQTVLDGYPFPEIYIAAGEVDPVTGEGKEMLVDGQQRLTTLKQYFEASPDLRLSKEVISYSKLPEGKQVDFLEYQVVVRDLGKIDISKIKEVFQRINSTNYALNAMEIHNARFDGEIKRFAEKLAEDPFFQKHRVFYSNEVRRMGDVRFALSIVVTVMSTYFNRDNELENYLQEYNDTFEEKCRLEIGFQRVFKFIEACGFLQNSRVWRKADLFTLLVEIYRALVKENKPLQPAKVGEQLRQFYELVERLGQRGLDSEVEKEDKRIAEYLTTTRQATNDRMTRINRGKILQDVISGKFFDEKQD